jgi:CRP-like cAMP-binding protein
METVFAEEQKRIGHYLTDTPEQRYLRLLTDHPELLKRVPQYHLASYLGIQPESLSRIRKRIASKDAGL